MKKEVKPGNTPKRTLGVASETAVPVNAGADDADTQEARGDNLADFQREESAQPDPLAEVEYRDDDKVLEHEDVIPASTVVNPGLTGYPPPGFIPTPGKKR